MIELIPAIDIIEGNCVRLQKGDYETKKTYDFSPVDVAKEVEQYGYKRLHIVDLDGAKSKQVVNLAVLEEIASKTELSIDFGGGIKTSADLQRVMDCGASYATIGSIAVSEPDMFQQWLKTYGSDRIILGADVQDGCICINGWKERSQVQLIPFLEGYHKKGVRTVLCTDISKDGMLQGTSNELYASIMTHFPDLHLIASGGVSSIEDIKQLSELGIPAVVFGKAVYEGRIDLKRLALEFGL